MTKSVANADFVKFTEEILNGKLHFLCKVVPRLWQKDHVGGFWKSNNRLFCQKNLMPCKSVKLDKKVFINLT